MAIVTTYFLEMNAATSLIAKQDANGLEINKCEIDEYRFNRFLYQLVGEDWDWIDRLPWTDQDWSNYVDDEILRTWVAYYKGSPAGYYELQQQLRVHQYPIGRECIEWRVTYLSSSLIRLTLFTCKIR